MKKHVAEMFPVTAICFYAEKGSIAGLPSCNVQGNRAFTGLRGPGDKATRRPGESGSWDGETGGMRRRRDG